MVRLSERLDLPLEDVQRRATRALREMWTVHKPLTSNAWQGVGHVVTGRYEMRTHADLDRLRTLDAKHPLVILFSHRSYLDLWLLRDAVRDARLGPIHVLAGANLNFWPVGPVLRRTGALFIRRDTKNDPVYRFVLRGYIRYLLDTGNNLAWSIEGGRTRTGKLRPPRYGALRYVVDALRASEGPEAYIVPVSVVYDQLGEVATMAGEALGESKRPEDMRWLLKFSMMQRNQGGVARIDMGEPLAMRARIAELEADPKASDKIVERIAVAACHRINRATPATPTAAVTVALLGAERALTKSEVEATVAPILKHLTDRPHLVSELSSADEGWIGRTLEDLTASGVLIRFDGGIEPVYRIAPEQHLVAAFYRNTLIHLLVTRAIGELAMFMARDAPGNLRDEISARALEMRDLLKFEFFFARRSEFEAELMAEVGRFDPEWEGRKAAPEVITQEQVDVWFERSRPHVAHFVLRPFIDAYRLVAETLAEWPAEQPVDDKALLQRCIDIGRQWVLRRKLHSAESVTLELFKNALLLARHRGLLGDPSDMLAAHRAEFARQITVIADALAEFAISEEKENLA